MAAHWSVPQIWHPLKTFSRILYLQKEKCSYRCDIYWARVVNWVTVVRVGVDGIVEFLLEFERRTSDAKTNEAIYNFDYAGVETRCSWVPTTHDSENVFWTFKIYQSFSRNFASFQACNNSLFFVSSTLESFMRVFDQSQTMVCLSKPRVIFSVLGLHGVVKFDLSFII